MLAATAATWVAQARAERPLGVDVSDYQGDVDWPQVFAGGRRFAFVRAMHGSGEDMRFPTNMPAAKAAGVLAGPYHFIVPYDYPETQAIEFVDYAGDYLSAGYLRPAVDVEVGGGWYVVGADSLSEWVNKWIDKVQELSGVEAMVYCNSQYANWYLDWTLASRTLWIADWVTTDTGWDPDWSESRVATPGEDPPDGIGIWAPPSDNWQFWQYANMGNTAGHPSVPGISTRVDLDVFNGTIDELQAYVLGTSGASISVSPASLFPKAHVGRDAESQTLTIWNKGTNTLNYRLRGLATWLSVSPSSGASTGEQHTITVTYSTADLPVGIYSGSIKILDQGADNAPLSVPVTLQVFVRGDFDYNSYIDSADINYFIGCMSGPGNPQTDPACQDEDIDGDGDVDQVDFSLLQRCMTEPLVHVDPDCAS